MRGVTAIGIAGYSSVRISTHTPHARRDGHKKVLALFACRFQLTRLMRGVTKGGCLEDETIKISTHTPHARRDSFA